MNKKAALIPPGAQNRLLFRADAAPDIPGQCFQPTEGRADIIYRRAGIFLPSLLLREWNTSTKV